MTRLCQEASHKSFCFVFPKYLNFTTSWKGLLVTNMFYSVLSRYDTNIYFMYSYTNILTALSLWEYQWQSTETGWCKLISCSCKSLVSINLWSVHLCLSPNSAGYKLMTTNKGALAWKRHSHNEWAVLASNTASVLSSLRHITA